MGIRFHRSLRIAPGLRLNVSRTGLSLSVGKPGATLNLRPGRAAQATVGLPGTGLSYRQRIGITGAASAITLRGLVWFAVLVVACWWWLNP